MWQWHCWKWGKKNVVPKSGESKKKKCYVHNIFTINHTWLVIISLNLNLTLRFFFYSPQISEPHFFPPFSAMALPQFVCQNFFFFFLFTSGTPRTGSRTGQRKFGITVAEIQYFLSPPFSSSLSYFWLNFGNGNTEIQSLSPKSQITLNSTYNAN